MRIGINQENEINDRHCAHVYMKYIHGRMKVIKKVPCYYRNIRVNVFTFR